MSPFSFWEKLLYQRTIIEPKEYIIHLHFYHLPYCLSICALIIRIPLQSTIPCNERFQTDQSIDILPYLPLLTEANAAILSLRLEMDLNYRLIEWERESTDEERDVLDVDVEGVGCLEGRGWREEEEEEGEVQLWEGTVNLNEQLSLIITKEDTIEKRKM